MNADALRRRAEELKAEVVQKTADVEKEVITKADYREFVDKAAKETDEIAADLKAYGQAQRLSGAAEVTVPEVTSSVRPRSRIRSTRGTAAISSPTLAPCTHTRAPSGRGTALSPRRSGRRTECSLPRFNRCRRS